MLSGRKCTAGGKCSQVPFEAVRGGSGKQMREAEGSLGCLACYSARPGRLYTNASSCAQFQEAWFDAYTLASGLYLSRDACIWIQFRSQDGMRGEVRNPIVTREERL